MTSFRVPALLAGCLALSGGAAVRAQDWSTIKGRIVLKNAPAPAPINVTSDKEFCTKDGPVMDDSLEVSKDGGVRNVVVWLRPDNPNRNAPFPAEKINPALAKAAPVERVIDQPCCQFIPRVTAARAGDKLVIKNSAKVAHNTNMIGDQDTNPGLVFNVNLPAGGSHTPQAPVAAQRTPISFKCDVHPWMKGFIRVFDHPYFAITDENGNFEIKDAPAGKWALVVWHENGFHKGRAGALGLPVEVKGATTEIPAIDLELPK